MREGIARGRKSAGVDLQALAQTDDMPEDRVEHIRRIGIHQCPLRPGEGAELGSVADMRHAVEVRPVKDGFCLGLHILAVSLRARLAGEVLVRFIRVDPVDQVQGQQAEIQRNVIQLRLDLRTERRVIANLHACTDRQLRILPSGLLHLRQVHIPDRWHIQRCIRVSGFDVLRQADILHAHRRHGRAELVHRLLTIHGMQRVQMVIHSPLFHVKHLLYSCLPMG